MHHGKTSVQFVLDRQYRLAVSTWVPFPSQASPSATPGRPGMTGWG